MSVLSEFPAHFWSFFFLAVGLALLGGLPRRPAKPSALWPRRRDRR